MKTPTAFLSLAVALIITLLLSGAWTCLAAGPENASGKPGKLVAQTITPQHESLMERLQQQWHVDPLVAEAHNLSSTGWATPACAPRGPGQVTAITGVGPDRTEKCIQACMKRISLENPNGLLFCRSSCL